MISTPMPASTNPACCPAEARIETAVSTMAHPAGNNKSPASFMPVAPARRAEARSGSHLQGKHHNINYGFPQWEIMHFARIKPQATRAVDEQPCSAAQPLEMKLRRGRPTREEKPNDQD